MKYFTRPRNFFSRNSCLSGWNREPGYALIALMITVAVILVSLSAAIPSLYQEAQRQREQELIFRGNQYARAIFLFQQKMGRYPVSVKEMVQSNGLRFLRKPYRDPMTRGGNWRFIHATASGVLIDSRTQSLTPGTQPPGTGPSGSSFGGSSNSNSQGAGQGQPSGNPSGGSSFSLDSNSTSTGSSNPNQPPKPAPGCENQDKSGPSSAFFDNANTIQGAFIVGVASCSDKRSILVYNNKTKYSDWEFLGIAYAVTGLPTLPGQTGQPGQGGQPGTGGQGQPSQPGAGGMGQPGSPGSFGPSPSGGAPVSPSTAPASQPSGPMGQ